MSNNSPYNHKHFFNVVYICKFYFQHSAQRFVSARCYSFTFCRHVSYVTSLFFNEFKSIYSKDPYLINKLKTAPKISDIIRNDFLLIIQAVD